MASAANSFFVALSSTDRNLLRPHLSALALPRHFELEAPNKTISHAYFLDGGIASVVASVGAKSIEIGIIGWEGMSGIPVVMARDRSPHHTYMQIGGSGQRIKTADLRTAINKSQTLHNSMLRFAQSFMVQTASTAVANGCAPLETRLARWLLMAHDRVKGDDLSLTHEFLSLMLAVRRAGVTVALAALAKRGLVKPGRSAIKILDRDGLLKIAGKFYGVPEAELRRTS